MLPPRNTTIIPLNWKNDCHLATLSSSPFWIIRQKRVLDWLEWLILTIKRKLDYYLTMEVRKSMSEIHLLGHLLVLLNRIWTQFQCVCGRTGSSQPMKKCSGYQLDILHLTIHPILTLQRKTSDSWVKGSVPPNHHSLQMPVAIPGSYLYCWLAG